MHIACSCSARGYRRERASTAKSGFDGFSCDCDPRFFLEKAADCFSLCYGCHMFIALRYFKPSLPIPSHSAGSNASGSRRAL